MTAIIPIIGVAQGVALTVITIVGALVTAIVIVGALEDDTDLSETREDKDDGNS